MGERAMRHEHATAQDIKEMRDLTEQALRAGAFDFTTSRTDSHKTVKGDMVAGRYLRRPRVDWHKPRTGGAFPVYTRVASKTTVRCATRH